ncbi:16S rRNA (adenine(1518)-N(6)/adenine(1519)-N(6))-dimethyltransferase [bacterium]|nr:16S rRNA (adenine(1518)-N(6)/adenine(1519)-N(6))-dimethyltransferase [bacterium]
MPEKLGQNFLKDKTIAERIVKAADLKPSDFVIEIGPGKGILTKKLAERAEKVIAVEIDRKLVDYLQRKFINKKNIEIINNNILKINLLELQNLFSVIPAQAGIQNVNTKPNNSILGSRSPIGAEDKLRGNDMERKSDIEDKYLRYKVVANLPYYITSPVIRMFLESEYSPREMILMVQKEVAERITAAPGKMSLLSVSVQYYARPEILFYVDKKSFNPVPKVDSAVIKAVSRKYQVLNGGDKKLPLWKRGKASEAKQGDLKISKKGKLSENSKAKEKSKKFFKIVRAGFCARRKTLVNNLSNSLQLDKKEVQEKLKAVGLPLTARAQELSIEDWKKLTKLF